MCLRLAIAYMSGYESYPLIFMWSEEVTMGLLELFLLAIGLSMDAFAVSVCKGLAMQKVNFRSAAICGVWFGGFQALMPFIGYLLGAGFEKYINAVASWIAFVLLALIGGNMIRGGGDDSEDGESCSVDPTKGRKLLILAVATSIDALAVGLSFSLLNINVWGPSTLIGVVCAVITALGLLAGKGLAHADIFGRRAELVGGCVLIGIGLKILYEHGVLS